MIDKDTKQKLRESASCIVSPDGINCRMFNFFNAIPAEVFQNHFDDVNIRAIEDVLLNDEDRETIQMFLHNHLNINATSKALGIHRNTLNYRIDRINKQTGLDVQKLCDAFIFHALVHRFVSK